jgi:hypothetical protein
MPNAGWRTAELCGLDASQPLKRGASPCAGLSLCHVWLRLCRIALHSWPAKSQRFLISMEIRLLAAHGMQCPLDGLGIARDDGEVGFSRLVGLRAALFPIPQSSKRDSESRGKFLLGEKV